MGFSNIASGSASPFGCFCGCSITPRKRHQVPMGGPRASYMAVDRSRPAISPAICGYLRGLSIFTWRVFLRVATYARSDLATGRRRATAFLKARNGLTAFTPRRKRVTAKKITRQPRRILRTARIFLRAPRRKLPKPRRILLPYIETTHYNTRQLQRLKARRRPSPFRRGCRSIRGTRISKCANRNVRSRVSMPNTS
jgi:hypothetical protein